MTTTRITDKGIAASYASALVQAAHTVGGTTISTHAGSMNLDKGLMVGQQGRGIVLKPYAVGGSLITQAASWVLSLDLNQDEMIGSWLDTNTGLIHLDVSIAFETHSEARQACIASGEIAYFDLSTGQEVRV